MAKKKMREFLREWDEGNFDFTFETANEERPEKERPLSEEENARIHRPLVKTVRSQERAFSRMYPVLAALLLLAVIGFLLHVIVLMPPFNSADTPANSSDVIRRYISFGLSETGAVNIVAGVILDYRAFDTLGESHVLFAAAAAVMILMLREKEEEEPEEELRILRNDLVLRNTAKVLVPFLMMFGAYVILNGHLGPGGGFSGGAVIGGALILYSAAFAPGNLSRMLHLKNYRIIVMLALGFYSVMKCYSFFCGANGLHTVFSPGTPGRILSAGLILPLNVAVGLVVACTMYGFYSIFTRGRI
ncbi:MAG: hypothetical protein IKR59_03985 [Lachnospiraceae bacterium]|nr:hypothetical protein [Lachnospiraceae bacterium]